MATPGSDDDESVATRSARADHRRSGILAAVAVVTFVLLLVGTALLVDSRRENGRPVASPASPEPMLVASVASALSSVTVPTLSVAPSPVAEPTSSEPTSSEPTSSEPTESEPTQPATPAADLVHPLPGVDEEQALSRAPGGWPERVSLRKGAPTLAKDPVSRALALMQTSSGGTFEILVLGDEGRVRTLGVTLAKTRAPEEGVEPSLPGVHSSLRRDGLRAAFPQPDAVIMVDLTTGAARRYAVPGLNQGLQWHPDGNRIIVLRREGSDLLDTRTGKLTPYQAVISVQTADPARMAHLESAQLDVQGDPVILAQLTRLDPETGARTEELTTLDARINPIGVGGFERAGYIALEAQLAKNAAQLPGVAEPAYSIAVIEAKTGQLGRALVFGKERAGTRCCQALGWYDDDSVIVQSDQRLLTWNFRTGALARLTEFDQFANLAVSQP